MSGDDTWQAVPRGSGDGAELLTTTLRDGGTLEVGGPPPAVEALTLATNQSLPVEQRRLVLELDLEGWEGTSDLFAFARYRASLGGDAESEALRAAESLAAGSGVFQAAMIALLSSGESPGAEALATMSETASLSRRDFVERLVAWNRDRRLAILTARGDLIPQPLRLALHEVAAGGDIAWIHGSIGSAGAVEAGLQLEAGVVTSLDERLDSARLAAGDEDTESVRQASWQVLEALLLLETPIGLDVLISVLVQRGVLSPADIEALTDRIDDLFVDELSLLEDLGFLHPAFDDSTYRPADPAAAHHLRQKYGPEAARVAEGWIEDLRGLLPYSRRSTSVLLLKAARLAFGPQHSSSLRLAQRLAWWADEKDLKPALDEMLRREEIRDEEMRALGRDHALPPDARRLFLETREQRGLPPADEGSHWLSKAQTLDELGLEVEALEAAHRGLEWSLLNHGRESEPFLAAQVISARLMVKVGELTAARDELLEAQELAAHVLAADDPRWISLTTQLGEVYMRIGELRAARQPLEEAVALARRIHGDDHLSTMVQRNVLASLLIDIGELEEAGELLTRALDAAGGRPALQGLSFALFHNLQSVTLRLAPKDPRMLEDLLERSVGLFGEHPSQIPLLAQLGQTLRESGQPERALELIERGVELAERYMDVGDPQIAGLQNLLSSFEGPTG